MEKMILKKKKELEKILNQSEDEQKFINEIRQNCKLIEKYDNKIVIDYDNFNFEIIDKKVVNCKYFNENRQFDIIVF